MTPEKKLLFISVTQIIILLIIVMFAFAGITIVKKISTMERQACLKNNAELWQNTGINLICKDTRGTFTINRFGDKITPTIITIP